MSLFMKSSKVTIDMMSKLSHQFSTKIIFHTQSHQDSIFHHKLATVSRNCQSMYYYYFQDGTGVPCHEYFFSLKNVTFCGFHPRDQRYFGFITKVVYFILNGFLFLAISKLLCDQDKYLKKEI